MKKQWHMQISGGDWELDTEDGSVQVEPTNGAGGAEEWGRRGRYNKPKLDLPAHFCLPAAIFSFAQDFELGFPIICSEKDLNHEFC